jgi:hypothetical protein
MSADVVWRFYATAEHHMPALVHAVSFTIFMNKDSIAARGIVYHGTASVIFTKSTGKFQIGRRVASVGCAAERAVDAEQEACYALAAELDALGAEYRFCADRFCGYCATICEERHRRAAAQLFRETVYFSTSGRLTNTCRDGITVPGFEALAWEHIKQYKAVAQAPPPCKTEKQADPAAVKRSPRLTGVLGESSYEADF